MSGPYFIRLSDNRIRMLQGGLELVVACEGPEEVCEAAYTRGWKRFQAVYGELQAERELLAEPLGDDPPDLAGKSALRMLSAAWPFRALNITPAAAVAGAVAEDILEAMLPAIPLLQASVDMRGRMAFWLRDGEALVVEKPGLHGWAPPAAVIAVPARDAARGLATARANSGMPATATTLAPRAAEADLAAALIARIASAGETAEDALDRGAAEARLLVDSAIITGCALLLHGETRVIGGGATLLPHGGFGGIFTEGD